MPYRKCTIEAEVEVLVLVAYVLREVFTFELFRNKDGSPYMFSDWKAANAWLTENLGEGQCYTITRINFREDDETWTEYAYENGHGVKFSTGVKVTTLKTNNNGGVR